VSHLGVQVLTLLTISPASAFFSWAELPRLQALVASQPVVLQVLEVILVADLVEYAVHRAFHAAPILWRFHAVHHSSRALDWLAGSRLHVVDIVATRGASFLPIFLLGFDLRAVYPFRSTTRRAEA
jgi:sterol desaturase/sphingolipid hydroxylase (fatty acid hydroxylase superfamily)